MHVINGTLLIVAAIWLVVVAVRARVRLAVTTSGLGLLSVLAAFYGGEEFIHKGGASGYSMLMGVLMAVALLCYVVKVWAFGGRGTELAGRGSGHEGPPGLRREEHLDVLPRPGRCQVHYDCV